MVLFPALFGSAGLFSDVFLNPGKLPLALSFIVPLILLYLIRPKPVNVQVPSLMFILKDMGKSNVHRLFRTLFRDILFLIQLLIFLLLALAIAKPFINVTQNSLVDQTILVIDESASAAANGRWSNIQDEAIASLSKTNIVIMARTNPILLEENGDERLSAGQAKNLIQDAKPADIAGDIPTALTLAEKYVGPNTKVVIVSDLVLSAAESPSLIETKTKLLKSKGAIIELKTVPATGKNIGIVDAQLNTENATATLKIQNFNEQPEDVTLDLNGDEVAIGKSVLAPRGQPGSLLSITVPLGHGTNEFTLKPKDDFATDNKYYISIPDQEWISILMITNDEKAQQSKLIPALEGAGDEFTKVAMKYATPPKVPDLAQNIYIVKDVNTEFILPGVIKSLRDEVEQGKVLVVFAQDNLFSLDWGDVLPVSYKSAQPLGGRQDIRVNASLALLRGLSDIGQVDGSQLLRVKAAPDAIVYASVPTNDGLEPVIAAKRIGKGAVIYYGIKDRNTFDIDPQSYAIIWGRIVDFSLVNPVDLNIPTGTVLNPRSQIRTPDGKRDPPVIAEHTGIYQTSTEVLAANLYPLHSPLGNLADTADTRTESAIAQPADVTVDDATADNGESPEDVKVPKDMSVWFMVLGLLILLFELFYVKYRGDF